MDDASRGKGFSILELLIVVSILMVLGVIAIPNMMTVISNARLQGGGTSLSGLLQNCRMLAVKTNTTMTTNFTVLGNGPVAYVKILGDTSALNGKDPQAQLGAPLTKVSLPSGSGGEPAPLTDTELGFSGVLTSNPSFNSRGLPTTCTGTVCSSPAGFVYYFKDNRPLGKIGWIAVSVSPAGRIKRWVYNGSAWGS